MLSAAHRNVKPAKDRQQALFDLKQRSVTVKRSFDELAGALSDPLVVPRSAWSSDIPAWLKHQITLERMIAVMETKGDIEMATDAEACAYLMPLTLESPLSHEWTEIYLYVSTKTCRAAGKDVPADIAVEKLDRQSMDELIRLKRWIYRKRREHRASGQRPEKAERKRRDEIVSQIPMGW
jgi:hypothetical protein